MNIESPNSLTSEKQTFKQEESAFKEEELNQEEVAQLQEDVFSVSDSEIEKHKIFWQEN